jgi:hypothetical protein
MKTIEVRLVAEKLEPFADGRDRWQVGYEHEGMTNLGWACDNPENGFLRILSQEVKQAINLSQAVQEHAAVIEVLALEIARYHGITLSNPDWPAHYVVAAGFRETQMGQLETRLSDWQNRLTDGHRCEHHRTCLDNCAYCPEGLLRGREAAMSTPIDEAKES